MSHCGSLKKKLPLSNLHLHSNFIAMKVQFLFDSALSLALVFVFAVLLVLTISPLGFGSQRVITAGLHLAVRMHRHAFCKCCNFYKQHRTKPEGSMLVPT